MGVEPLERHLDRPDADFHQPARDEAPRSERSVAISGPYFSRLLFDLEGLELFGSHHSQRAADRFLVQRPVGLEAAAIAERPFDDVQVFEPAFLSVMLDSGLHVLKVLPWIGDLERIVIIAEKPAAGGPGTVQDRDVPRDFNPRHRQFVGDDRPQRRMDDCRIGTVASLEQVRPALMVPFFGDHRANHAQIVDLFGGVRQKVRDLKARKFRIDGFCFAADFRAGMGIESLQLAGPALHPQGDQRFGAFTAARLRCPQIEPRERK